ncbi:UNVERIFIED_CONTAM: hypothetical protein RMT77_005313 [Armadillidium vulgare]
MSRAVSLKRNVLDRVKLNIKKKKTKKKQKNKFTYKVKLKSPNKTQSCQVWPFSNPRKDQKSSQVNDNTGIMVSSRMIIIIIKKACSNPASLLRPFQ